MAEKHGAGDLRAMARDPAVVEAYYEAHFDLVQNYLARRIRDPQRVADLTADVFLAAIDSAHTYRPSRGSPRVWTYGIARNILAAELRREERERRAVSRIVGRRLLSDDDTARLEERIDAQAAVRRLAPAMDQLADGERALLELIAVDGLSTREAAVVLGVSVVTARVRLHRARRRLHQADGAASLGDMGMDPLLEVTP